MSIITHREHIMFSLVFFFINVMEQAFYFSALGSLNRTIIILFGVYVAGAIGSLVRSWLFTLAGQRLVARIRKEVSICLSCVCLSIQCEVDRQTDRQKQ